jgi:hypothetical protein
VRRICASVALVDAVDTYLSTYPESPVVLDVLGTVDGAAIKQQIQQLEPATTEIFAFACSVGATFGLLLEDGSRVALKIHKLFRDPAYFRDVQCVQGSMREAGFPAPRPVRVHGAVTVEEWIDDGVFRDAHDGDVRRAMADVLARFVELASGSGVSPRRASLTPEGELWPKPHNKLFDFEATASGAEWIDEIGARAAAVEKVGRAVVGHLDWAAKHVRFDSGLQPTAVYDWDSVTTEFEPVVAGQAAASFTYTEELNSAVERWPTPDESSAFLADYDRARGSAFAAAERRTAGAACVYLLAYAARCGHAIGADLADSSLRDHARAFL